MCDFGIYTEISIMSIHYYPTQFHCMVYVKPRPTMPYTFSHMCNQNVFQKPFPKDLTVTTLIEYKQCNIMNMCYKQVVIVLVTGDIARCITLHQPPESAIPFLYYNSIYNVAHEVPACVEIDEKYIQYEFKSTMAYFKDGLLEVCLLIFVLVFFLVFFLVLLRYIYTYLDVYIYIQTHRA